MCAFARENAAREIIVNLAECLREMKTVVTVPEPIAMRARRTVEAMLAR